MLRKGIGSKDFEVRGFLPQLTYQEARIVGMGLQQAMDEVELQAVAEQAGLPMRCSV